MVMGEGLPSGRERAIETLIDMEPQGAYYRAARVVEEVVPQALANRPNLVTKGALVEQAHALAENELDSVEKYDELFGSEPSKRRRSNPSDMPALMMNTTDGTAAASSSGKDRILRHHAKMCSVRQLQNSSSSITPSPQLVAALRQIYGTTGSASEAEPPALVFRPLLKAVMNHKVFDTTTTTPAAITSTNNNNNNNEDDDVPPVAKQQQEDLQHPSSADGKASLFQVETLIANVCRSMAEEDNTNYSNEASRPPSHSSLQGLLIALLSVVTTHMSDSNHGAHAQDIERELRMGKNKNKGDGNNNTTNIDSSAGSTNDNPKRTTTKEEDPVVPPAMQVGSLLSLLQLPTTTEGKDNKDPLDLDPELLEFFGQAAVAYEGRIELQKARLLAKLRPAATPDLEPAVPVTESPAVDAGESPLALTPTNTSNNTDNPEAFVDQVAAAAAAVLDEEEEEEDAAAQLERLAEATLSSSVAALEQIMASATGEETSSNNDVDEEADISSESDDNSGSGSDSEESGGEDEDNNILAEYEQEVAANNEDIAREEDGSPADEADDVDVDSSSSSSDDWGIVGGGQEGVGGEDDDDDDDDIGDNEDEENDDEEEDDDVLRQALALSLIDQDNREAAEVESATGQQAGSAQQGETTLSDQAAVNETDAPMAQASAVDNPPTLVLDDQQLASTSVSRKPESDDTSETSLPPLPSPPPVHPYASLLGQPIEVDSDQAEATIDDQFAPYFEPSALTKFASLPTANVIFHLLKYSVLVIERAKFSGRSESSRDDEQTTTAGLSSVPGGMGGSLFPPEDRFVGNDECRTSGDSSDGSGIATTLLLLVALFLHIMDKRNDAIESLRKAAAQEELHVQGEDEDEDSAGNNDNDERSESTPLSSGEEDDPALALAMSYVENSAAESTESLEAKGMIRKAAAAAHDAATVLKLLKRRTEAWKQSVKLYSQCSLCALKSLRLFLQSTVRQWLLERSPKSDVLCPVDCSEFLPSLVGSKLSMSLASLMSVTTHNSFVSIKAAETSDFKDCFMSLSLYKEAVTSWGECVPLLYPSAAAQVEILRSLISECSSRSSSESLPYYRPLEALTAVPSSDIEAQVHRLQVLCRRLRVSDLLDNLVSRPACFLPDEKADLADATKAQKKPYRSSVVASLVGSAWKQVAGGKGDLQRLYLALCHRCHVRVLLWDGLFECSERELDDVAASVVSPAMQASDVVRISANPTTSLQFDATKCSDSIAIVSGHGESSTSSNGSSVNQRASKVWGTVLSTQHYSPKTGVHRWAVRLDKCERGHVFVGVATAQASTRTYVGGDRYGWGMIGTQALWHDRRKIRGDYGATFRTGSTIIVTLDTDAGTLSFSSWKDSTSSTSYSLDPILQNHGSSRRHGHIVGTMEDWGIAFEGLPLDSRLYPAVGMYQRDDKVTLISVESGSRAPGRDGALDISGGLCYYPLLQSVKDKVHEDAVANVRAFNDALSWEGVQYVIETLRFIASCSEENGFVATSVLPSLAAALCLVPNSIPVLSERFAINILPHLSKFILELDRMCSERQMVHRLFRSGLKPGKWLIRATGSSGVTSDYEEYLVDIAATSNDQGLSTGFEGSGLGTTGKSKNGIVSIFGTVKGSSVHFVEEWSDGREERFGSTTPDDTSSCVVAARLSLDGTKFEGTYRNVQFGTTGHISGLLRGESNKLSKLRLKDAPAPAKQSAELAAAMVSGEAILSLAHNHMATIIAEDGAGDHRVLDDGNSDKEQIARQAVLKVALSWPLLSALSIAESPVSHQMEFLKTFYSWNNNGADDPDSSDCHYLHLLQSDLSDAAWSTDSVARSDSVLTVESIEEQVEVLDAAITEKTGGRGSFWRLCPEAYDSCRKRIICTFVRPCGVGPVLFDTPKSIELEPLWRASLKIVEDGLRHAMSTSKERTRKEVCLERCALFEEISLFLLSLNFSGEVMTVDDASNELSFLYGTIASQSDVLYLKNEMEAASRRSLLRLISLREVVGILSTESGLDVVDSPVALESLVAGLPRLLGRSQKDAVSRLRKPAPSRHGTKDANELGVRYSSSFAGSNGLTRLAIRQNVHQLFSTLGRIAEKALARRGQSNSMESVLSIDSLLLSVLAVFTTPLKREDVESIILDSGIMSVLSKLVALHRDGALTDENVLQGDESASVVKKLKVICQREISRSILRASVAATHALTFQAVNTSTSSGPIIQHENQSMKLCLDMLLEEMSSMVKCVENAVDVTSLLSKRCSRDWEKWREVACPFSCSSSPTSAEDRRQVGSAGLLYLQEFGTSHSSPLSSSQKPSSRQKGVLASRDDVDQLTKLQGSFSYQLLAQWLHVACCALKSSSSLALIAHNPSWSQLLLSMVGLSTQITSHGGIEISKVRTFEDGLLPGRFRARVLRLMLSLLNVTQPSEAIIEGLFQLAGVTCLSVTRHLDEDENLVSREAGTLLRYLHSPSRPLWRESVNRVITKVLSQRESKSDWDVMLIGVLSFFSGGQDSLALARGSYVLLKPAAAAPLAGDQLPSPSSKSHSSASAGGAGSPIGATPHHIVGNGTEGVVAGLCRQDASAGIVSSIDMKNSICEVILLQRDQKNGVDSNDGSSQMKGLSPDGTGGASPRSSLTVRALRTSLSDVVLAQEVPLYLDDSMAFGELFGSLIRQALDTLFSALNTGASPLGGTTALSTVLASTSDESGEENAGSKGLRSGAAKLSASLIILRSAIVILSDKQILSTFAKDGSCKDVLSRILSLAWPLDAKGERSDPLSNAQRQFLSSLPMHEARYSHLVSMLNDLCIRRDMHSATSNEEWRHRLEYLRLKQTEDAKKKETTEDLRALATESGGSGTPAVVSSSAGTGGNTSTDSSSRNADSSADRAISQSTMGSNSDDDEESEAATTAAAHLREAAIAQMAELGLPRSWSELALRRTGGANIEAAVHFCLERGGEMERLLAEERERERLMQRQSSASQSSRRRGYRSETGTSNHLLRQLLEMGFPSRWCAEALAATGNNVDEALTWILTNGERLSEEDEAMEEGGAGEDIDDDDDDSAEDEDDDDDEEDEDDAMKPDTRNSESASDQPVEGSAPTDQTGWSGSVVPLRFISGRSIIDSKTLAISGLPTGGFSSVGTKGILLSSGKWYYEAILETAGCLQIGWADGSFAGHCHADRGDGCGDGPSSWAYDGWRRYRWHSTATEWGCRWKEGDVVGCLVDMDNRIVSFTLNGRAEEIGMGVAFSGEGFRPCGGVYACVSFNRREKLRLILGGSGSEPFKYNPPPGYQGVGAAVLEAVKEREVLATKESILDATPGRQEAKRFLCDFSDGEHGHELMAWAHRYYGSDASVHLGSGRSKQSSSKQSASSSLSDSPITSCITRRVVKEWTNSDVSFIASVPEDDFVTHEQLSLQMSKGYERASDKLSVQLVNEAGTMAILFARKLILHMIVTMGEEFDLKCFVRDDGDAVACARQFWKVVEACASLRCAGWVGEAGAMAVAAEALGLGISSNDHGHSRQTISERAGMAFVADLDDGVLLPAAGITQLLSSVQKTGTFANMRNTGSFLAASAEAAIGSDGGGGVLIFLQRGLQSAVCKADELRDVVIAAIRRSVRLLAVVEYEGDDSDPSDLTEEDPEAPTALGDRKPPSGKEDENEDPDVFSIPDARLVSFLSGLVMSKPIEDAIGKKSYRRVLEDLFQAWSIGLLSASLPWRMVCSFTAAGILNKCPPALLEAASCFPTLARFYGRLESTVSRRVWAERAAVPVCSRYVQSMIELLSAVRMAASQLQLPPDFTQFWGKAMVDAATPLPVELPTVDSLSSSWESDQGWLSSDIGWEVWTGKVEYMAVEWKTPSRSAVRTLMDGGEGPPMLREGCHVMRGMDWESEGSGSKGGNEDGKPLYEAEKAKRDEEKRRTNESSDDATPGDPKEAKPEDKSPESATEDKDKEVAEKTTKNADALDEPKSPEQDDDKKPKRKLPSPKLALGTVVSIEPWNGIPGLGRRVRWHLTGEEGVYRYGGDGGRYDIIHVEVNDKFSKVKKRHPVPESAEQCASRHGFGANKTYSVLLRLQRHGTTNGSTDDIVEKRLGILEWPDFGAGVRVTCTLHANGAVTLTEDELVYGSKDSGWEARFGQPSYVPGTSLVLNPISSSSTTKSAPADRSTKSSFLSMYEGLLGSTTFPVTLLRNREGGSKLQVTSEMHLYRGRQRKIPGVIEAPTPPPILFDREYHASSMSLSRDGRTVSCISSDGRGAAFATVGFTKGVHYWEVKLEQADIGSVFIGVAEKPDGSGSGSSYGYDSPPRLNRWPGWGFVNFRATYASGAERVYGAHCHAGDTIGVLLDCDAGRVSFFFDGLKYGEHILNDLGCAFENLSPFGFNVDGCGSGGAGQGAPSGIEAGGRSGRYPAQGLVRPRALWPVIGLRNQGDRVTISPKWTTSYGVDGITVVRNLMAVDEVLLSYSEQRDEANSLPDWFVREAFNEYKRWHSDSWTRSVSRGSGPYRHSSIGLDVELDASPVACATASASLGLKHALLAGDRVRLLRSAGRILELAEEAMVLGAYHGRLFYRIMSQKSEGGSLNEGGGRAWCWDESEVVDGLPYVGKGKAQDIDLPLMARFRCTSPGGIKIVYDGGAVMRSDLEIFDGSVNLGAIPFNSVIPKDDVLERRVNSCGVVRFRVRFEPIGEGWISGRIRGGKEEPIIEPVQSDDAPSELADDRPSFPMALDCALEWYEEYKKTAPNSQIAEVMDAYSIKDFDSFKTLAGKGLFSGIPTQNSDSLLAATISCISNFSECGDAVDCRFHEISTALEFSLGSKKGHETPGNPAANQAAAAMLSSIESDMPPVEAVMARAALIRAFNRRARLALPWMSVRPCQEGSSILGGLTGHGAAVDRAGRTRLLEAQSLWVQVPSIASRIRTFRRLFFTSVKRGLLQGITEATATPTPLSHDEYELPREIRTVRINRLRARIAMAGMDNSPKRKYSVFAQLQNETKSWGGAALRRCYVAKGHGGQRRAFKVKLIGEGVNDYSGPYREAFTDAMAEVLDLQQAGRGSLGVLDPTPNNSAEIGENRELFMFSLNGLELNKTGTSMSTSNPLTQNEEARIRQSFSSLLEAKDEPSREVEEALVFLGRLSGAAFRHGIPVDLPLPLHTVWKSIVEEATSDEDRVRELDLLAHRQLSDNMAAPTLLWWQQRMLNSFIEGLSNVLPVEVLTILDGEELRDILCGNPEVDVDLLRSVVEYEGYVASDAVIGHFWETLRELSNADRKLFLQFVWARNRLPLKKSDFEAPFKIQRDSVNAGERADSALPSASTCFFSLSLPEYSSKEIMKEKLQFAIRNVATMETDFQTNSAEIAEGYRAV